MLNSFRWLSCLAIWWQVLACLQGMAQPSKEHVEAGIEFFEKEIRPMLSEYCYECHSVRSEKVKGGLLLDSQPGMLKGGDDGPVIVPGQANRSKLIEAIRYENKDLQMPPKRRLTPRQVESFTAWINMGVPDPRTNNPARVPVNFAAAAKKHWAFKPVSDPPVPSVKQTDWPRTPIDFFILSKLEERGLSPAPRADKRTLIRRASFDLTGLPPAAEEVESFMRDSSPQAFATVVDRLLASPRYGERWGRYWLDVARYADTKGYVYSDREEARFVQSYAYRDWVIRAFNQDMPYDRFLLLQIAGDQIAGESDRDSLAALGFLTLGRRFLGVIHDIIDDRIDVVMRGTQALTVGCARCHDHKFDPIPTQDYYSLYGVFASCTEKMLPLGDCSAKDSGSQDFVKGLEERSDKYQQTLARKREDFSNRFRAKVKDYLVAVLDVKKLPTEEHYEIRGPDDLNPIIARSWESYLLQTKSSPHPVFYPWHTLAALPETEMPAKVPELLKQWSAATNGPRINSLVLHSLQEKPPASMRDVAERYGDLFAAVHRQWQEALRTAVTNNVAAPSALPDSDQEELRRVLYGPGAPVNVPMLAAADLEWYFDEATRVELMKQQSEIERWIIKSPKAPPYAVILEDRPIARNPRVFVRGNPANKGEEVPRRFLAAIAGEQRRPFQIGSGRLELARAIASPENPLTARVMVNRVWLHHFGAGLVRTPSDFGARSEPPSHPELLDWLARRFVEDGWSLKKLHRMILLSDVYQQSSEPSSFNAPSSSATAAAQADPENRLLWKMNSQRLDFESMRDTLLAASGELDSRMNGPAGELFKEPANPRRTIYGLVDRQFLPSVFRVFDFSNPDMHSPQRSDTTVPQQALFFMNSPFVADRSRALLNRPELSSTQEARERIDRLYEILFQRHPSKLELDLGTRFITSAESEPAYVPPKPLPRVWQYGYGEFGTATGRTKAFTALPHFTDEAWQGGDQWPDAKLGWVRLTADGGHVGNDLEHAAIRRWVSPIDGEISIRGTIKHDHTEGDGVHARIVSSAAGSLGEWSVHNGKAETSIPSIIVRKGDTIDFIVDLGTGLNNDDFHWNPTLKPATARDSGSDRAIMEWNAKKEFSGPSAPPMKPLRPWERYAQALLLSNEFVFVD